MRRWLKEYASETPIHGFGLIFTGSTVVSVFWAITVVVSIAFALNDFVNLVTTYQSEPTMLSVSVVSNSNFTFATPTICMETGVFYVGKDRKSPNYWLGFDTVGIENEIQQFLLATENATKLDFDFDVNYVALNIGMDKRLYYYTYALVAYWTDAELAVVDQQINWHRHIFTNWSRNDPNLLESLETVYIIYRKYNVSLPYLKMIVGYHMCSKLFLGVYQYKYYGDSQKYYPSGCRPRLITHVGFSLICTRILNSPKMQIGDGDQLTFLFYNIEPWNNYPHRDYYRQLTNPSKDPQYLGKVRHGEIMTSLPYTDSTMDNPDNTWVNFRWFLDLQGRSTLSEMVGNDIFNWNPLINTNIEVSIAYEYQFYNAKWRRCATETQYECEWRQRVEQIHKRCGCWPSSFIFAVNSSLEPFCEVNLTSAYKGELTVGQCVGKTLTIEPCMRPCQVLSYDSSNFESAFFDVPYFWFPLYRAMPKGQFELTIKTSTKRLLIAEIPCKTWLTFASEFGGSIGTWLGASLLAFVHIPFFFCKKITEAAWQWKSEKKNLQAPKIYVFTVNSI